MCAPPNVGNFNLFFLMILGTTSRALFVCFRRKEDRKSPFPALLFYCVEPWKLARNKRDDALVINFFLINHLTNRRKKKRRRRSWMRKASERCQFAYKYLFYFNHFYFLLASDYALCERVQSWSRPDRGEASNGALSNWIEATGARNMLDGCFAHEVRLEMTDEAEIVIQLTKSGY